MISDDSAEAIHEQLVGVFEAWNDFIDLVNEDDEAGEFSEGMREAIAQYADYITGSLEWFHVAVHKNFADPTKDDFFRVMKMFGASDEDADAEWERKQNRYIPINQLPEGAVKGSVGERRATKNASEGESAGEQSPTSLSLEALWDLPAYGEDHSDDTKEVEK